VKLNNLFNSLLLIQNTVMSLTKVTLINIMKIVETNKPAIALINV